MKNILLGIVLILTFSACQQESPEVDEQIDESTPPTDQSEENVGESSSEENAPEKESAGQDNDSAQEVLSDEQYMAEKMSALSFYEFELEVEYANNKEYEAEIEPDKRQLYKAEVEDELKDVYLTGLEAFNEIYEKIEQLSVTSTSNHEDVLRQVLDVFNLPEDYVEIEIEIKFHDGTEIEIENYQ